MNIVTDTSLALFHDAIAQAWDALYKNDMAGAMSHARQAATIGPDLPETFHILGLLASRDGRSDIALPLLEKALAAGVTERRYRDLAEACLIAGDAQSALAYLQQALLEFERTAELCGLLAAVYVALDDYASAAEFAKEAISLKPNLMAWEGSLAFCHLIQGDYAAGFKIYTGRSQNLSAGSRCPALHLAQPGELWLKNEQGPGDTLFFARFAKPLAEAGWKIHLQTDKKTKVLLRDTGLFASVKEAIIQPLNAFWLNMGDLPLAAIQTGVADTPPPLALVPDQARIKKIKEKLAQIGPAPYLAVTWRAGARGAKQRAGLRMYDKIASPEDLGKLLSGINATIISIQRVPDSEEQTAFAAALGRDFINFSHYNDNLQDMLALLSVVDDYVAVPNTNVHLRESLGLSTHVLVNRPYQDWRWLDKGGASPWYPHSTVYRQDMNQDWTAAWTALAGVLHEKFGLLNSDSATLAISKPRMVQNEVEQMLQNGWAAVSSGDIPAAIQAAQSAMKLTATAKPGNENPEALHLLGWSAMRDLKLDLAVTILKKSCELAPSDGRIIGDCIRALSANGQTQEAINLATQALDNPDMRNRSGVYYGRAACYLNLNQPEKAIEDYQACMQINPNRLDAQEYCGMARLKLGDGVRGFRDCTARKVAQRDELLNDWCCPVLTAQHKGSRVLIKRDMGLGDELTYLRYLPWLKAAGIKVDYWAGRKLVPVLERMGYLENVYPDSELPPSADEYDLSFIVNDLPVAAHRLGAPDIAPPLALSPRADLVDKWSEWLKSLGDGPYIGLNWKAGLGTQGAGNIFSKLAKAVDAELFALALAPVKATFVSLQRNVFREELAEFEKNLGATLHDASALTDDIEDLLALLSLLDENIGVSNTNMHLRAGLGKGSRVMVQTPGGDWRWGVDGDTSVWFAESKVYRQTSNGEWDAPLQVLQTELVTKYGQCDISERAIEIGKSEAFTNANANQNKRLIWLTAGAIKNVDGRQTSELASARYRVIAPSLGLAEVGWKSEIVNEELSQAMGGWGSAVPKAGDTLIISKVFGEQAIKLARDAKSRGASIIVDFCDNFLDHPKRGPLQHALLKIADKVVAASEGMADAIKNHGYQVDAVISDPVEMPYGEPRFTPKETLQLLWFGHAVNIDTLKAFLPNLAQYQIEQPLHLTVVTALPNGKADLDKIIPVGLSVDYIPWSIQATQKAIADCDLVIIPVLSNQFKSAKSPNRLLESLWAGRMVVAGPLPAYLPFADSAWVGQDLVEGIKCCMKDPAETLARIQQGQADIRAHFTRNAICAGWDKVISDEKISSEQTKKEILTTGQPSPLETYFQAKEAVRILGLNNHNESQIKQTYFNYFAKKDLPKDNKIAVYTAIFGGYDTAPILNHIDAEIDYILYTDQPDFNAPSPWQVRVVPAVFKDPQVDARRLKILSHLFLPEYDITVWIDGNFTLEKLTSELVIDVASRAPVALCKHQFRHCIYDEAAEILKRGIDASTPVLRQIQYYQARQFPAKFGLHATSFLIRNHQDSQVIKMNMRWWELLSINSKRDQLSFDYVRWEMNIPTIPLPFNQRENELFEWGKNGQRQHKVGTRRNDEHEGRALNHEAFPENVCVQQQYQPLWDSWHTEFLKDLYALNLNLIHIHKRLASSILYQSAICANCLPDPRLAVMQRSILSKLSQARRVLQVGFDGGQLALMVIHHSWAKMVVVDESVDQYKQAGMDYLNKQHAKRVAFFSEQDIMQINEAMFDLVCINTNDLAQYQAMISKLQQLDKTTVFVDLSYRTNDTNSDNEVVLSKDIQSALIDESQYTRSTYGVWLKNRKNDLTWKFAVQGKYGFFYADWLKKQKESIFIDIGANIGLYSLIANTNSCFKAIYSFEPHPETYQFLTDNIQINQASKCIAHKLAISDRCEKQTIHVKPNHSGVATLREVKSSEGYQSSIEIECVDANTLDTLIQNPDHLPISIKIDVEGFELVVIQTLINTSFWPYVTNIYYEVDENYLDYKKLEAILLKQGFRFEAKNGDGGHYDLLFTRD